MVRTPPPQLKQRPRNDWTGARSGPVYRAVVQVGRASRGADVIAYEGEFWLVTEWLVTQDKKRMRPLRMVSLTGIPHEGGAGDRAPQFIVSERLPAALFAPATLPSDLRRKYPVVAAPDIEFANPQAQYGAHPLSA